MRGLLLLSLFCARALGDTPLTCDSTSGDVCRITTSNLALSPATYTCCTQSSFSLEADLECTGSCGFNINVVGSVSINRGKLVASGGSAFPIAITGDTISLQTGSNLTGPIIRLTSTSVNNVTAGVSCAASALQASATADNAPGLGTPPWVGTPLDYMQGGGRGLGAAHAGAGATGYDAAPRSLAGASLTYPSNPFALPEAGADIAQVMGSRGGANNISSSLNPGLNAPGLGGGVVWLSAPTSLIQLTSCKLFADGGAGQDAGGGSGGAVIVDGAAIAVSGTQASANGGGTVGTSANAICNGVPCGLPGGGGYVYARSGAAASGSVTKLLQWGAAAGGATVNNNGNQQSLQAGLCGGAGLLIDCQANSGADTDCDVGVVQASACATASAVASGCADSSILQTSTACLVPPTVLTCTTASCGALTLSSGANLTVPSAGTVVNRTITASASTFSSTATAPLLSANLDVNLTNVVFSTPSNDAARNYSVISTTGALSWSAKNMLLYGSLSVSSGAGLSIDFFQVNVSAAPAWSSGSTCSGVSWEGGMTLAGGTACTALTCPAGAAAGRVTVSGGISAAAFGAYAFNDVSIGTGVTVTALGCSSGAGPGNGSTAAIASGNEAAGILAGGGAGHHGAGGIQRNPGIIGNSGAAYDVDPFAIFPPVPVGGSGGGGDASATGGSGGGTIVLAGNGTLLRSDGAARGILKAAGSAGFGSATSVGGGGSGGSVIIALSQFNEAKPEQVSAMAALTLSASGGAGASRAYGSAPAITVCGGGGSGGNVIVAIPMSASALPIPPKVQVEGGAATMSCSPGPSGLAMFTLLPASYSFTMTATATGTSSSTSSFSSSSSASATATASAAATSSSSASASFSGSAAASASASASASATATASGSASATGTATATQPPSVSSTNSFSSTSTATASPSVSPSNTPAPQILGLKVPYFIAAATGGGILFTAVFVWILVKTACAPAAKGGMFVPSSPAGSMWSSTNTSGTGDRQGLLTHGADEDWGGGSGYVPPSGVV